MDRGEDRLAPDNDKDVFGRTRWFANGQEYFLHRMGADRVVTDPRR